MYRCYPLLFAALAVGVIAPYELARLAVTGVGPLGSGKSGDEGTLLLFELIYYVLVGPLISALHVHAVIEIGEGRRPRIAPVALRGLRVLAVVVAAEIVAGVLIGLGFIALIVPGVILSLRWSVVAQTAAVDHEGWMPALRRSAQLTAGHYWHIFRVLLAIGFLTFLVAAITGAFAGSGNNTSVASVLVGIVVYTIVASFGALTLAVLYFDLRAREAGPRLDPSAGYPDPPAPSSTLD
ncbi:MAG TPA: hypothetical protein VGP18_01065 [Solirubrobacteraceae bacterium]|jgi:hypothetical protein|nr:hypothetical protein [Solirubrobacteraceae bacterium]